MGFCKADICHCPSPHYCIAQTCSVLAREGEIHIRKTKGAGEKRVRKDVGDYIEFEEVPATETDKNDPDKQ